jgi:HNH endonuclease
MVQHQIHFGRKFYKDLKTGYWISCTCPKIRAHRWVWLKFHSLIPPGYHIHHVNEDKSDNRIENLELIKAGRHLSLHSSKPENRERLSKMADKYRPLTKIWHASEEGREWHKAHGILGWISRKEFKIICKVCNSESKTKTLNKEFCSNKCKSKWRRDQKLDYIEKVCPVCSKSYQTSIYSKSKTCGRECGRISRKNTLRK